MQIFKKIPDEIKTGCQRYLNALLKTQFGYQSEKAFVEIFNHDTDFIDQYLSYTDAEQAIYSDFDKAQSDYNETIIKAKKRWEKSKQSFYVAKNTMHEMSIHKKEFEKYKTDVKNLEANKSQFELLMGTEFLWTEIKKRINEKKIPQYESIKKIWRTQGIFGRYGYQDILKAYDHIISYEEQLTFWISKLSGQTHSLESKEFLDICQYNLQKCTELKQAICSTFCIRLNYAIYLQNLSIDDPVGWIDTELGASTGLKLATPSQLAICDLPKVILILKENAPDTHQALLESLVQKGASIESLIPYSLNQENFIPTELLADYPKDNTYFADKNFIVLQLNALKVSVEELFISIKEKKIGTIQQWVNHPGFKGLSDISRMISEEKSRAEQNKPNIIFLNISYISGWGSACHTDIFLTKWQDRLTKIETEYKSKAADLAKIITASIEADLFSDLEYNLFEFPSDVLYTFKDFILENGDEGDKKTVLNLFTPLYVISKFDFIKEYVNGNKVEIDDDKVQALLQYAKLYWSPEQIKGIETLTNLLEGEGFPKNVEEDSRFVKKIIPLFTGENAKKDLLNFLKMFSENYVSKITDPGNDSVYRFLLRFHPKLAELWTNEREQQIEQKYTEMCQLFSGMTLTDIDHAKIVNHINLLNAHDQKKKTSFIADLTPFIEGYITHFNGESNLLGEAMYALYQYNPENLTFLEKIIEKRIQFLIKKYLPLDELDMAWFYQMRKDFPVTERIIKILEKNYKGFADNMTNLFMVNTDSKLFSLVFTKYVTHNFLRLDQDQINSLMDTVSLLSQNETNKSIVDEGLMKAIDMLKGADYFNQEEQIQRWLKKHGSIKVVEHYFLNKLDVALQSNNGDALKITVAEISTWLGLKNQIKPIFTILSNQEALYNLYKKYFQSYHPDIWNSQYQYLTEWLAVPQTKSLTQLSRVKWFESFIGGKLNFNKEKSGFNLLDVNIHQANQAVPKADMSLSDFFGAENLDKVINLIRDKLTYFDINTPDEVYEIINRYLSEREIKSIPEGYLAYQELEICQKFVKLWNAILQRKFKESIQLHKTMMIDFKAINRLSTPQSLSSEKNKLPHRAKYFQNKLEQIKLCFARLIKQSLYDQFYLNAEKDQILQDIYIGIFGEQELSNLTLISQDAKELYAHFNELKNNLSLGKWNLVKFDLNRVSKVNAVVPLEKIDLIIHELIEPTKILGSQDRLKSIIAYTRLIQNDYLDIIDRKNDEETVNSFNHEQENIVICTKKVTTDMINKFKQCNNMTEIGKLFSKENSFRTILLTHIDPEHFGQLQHFLVLQLKGLFEGTCPKEYSELEKKWQANLFDIDHWKALSDMMDFVKAKFKNKKIPNEEGFLKLASSSMDIANMCFEDLNSIFTLQDLKNLKEERVVKENSCIRAAIFIRYFGDNEQKIALEKWLDGIAAVQRKIMMKGISNATIEEALTFVEKLIRFTGNEEQKIENDRLNKEWYVYHSFEGFLPQANIDEVVRVRKATLEEAFHDYVPEFDKLLFTYFLEKFKCDEKGLFHFVKECKIKFGSEYMIEVAQLIKDTDPKPIMAKLKELQLVTPQEQKQVLFFKYKAAVEPDKRDAIKFLFALGFSAKLHSLVHIFKKQLKDNPKAAVNRFSTALIRQPLTEMLNKLKNKYDFGKNQFIEGVQKSIDLEKMYFIDWNQANYSPRDETPNQIKLNVKNVA